jgi:hypothetical protein
MCVAESSIECDDKCILCAEPNNERACLDCAGGSLIKEDGDEEGLFSCTCAFGEFFDGSACSPCASPCFDCEELDTTCTACDSVFKRELVAGECVCMDGFEEAGSDCEPINLHNEGTACTFE